MVLPKLLPWPGQKLATPSGRPASSRSSKNFAAMVGESLDGFRMTVLPLTMEASVMPPMMAPGNFHGVEVAEVNQLGDVAIGLGPVLADLKDHPRHQLKLALAQQRAHPEQQVGALLDGGKLPGVERLQRGLHRGLNLACARRLVNSDNLRRLGPIDRLRLLRWLQVTAADDQVVLAAQFVADLLDSGLHAARVLRVAEINRWFVLERGGNLGVINGLSLIHISE